MSEIIREFLVETQENLAQLDIDLVTLEKDPGEKDTLSRVFRTMHTVKGTAGFLGFTRLQSVTHASETLLSRLRAGELTLNREITTALLRVVDAIRNILAAIEATEKEGDGDYSPLIQALERLTHPSTVSEPKRSIASPVEPRQVPTESRSLPSEPRPQPEPPRSLPPEPRPATPTETSKVMESVSIARSPSIMTGPIDPTKPRSPAVSDLSIRVDVGLLDKLMNLVGELVLSRNQIVQYSGVHEDSGFADAVQRLNLLTTELQSGVMKTRMQPIDNVLSKFPRIVRDLAVACGKQVRLDVDGQETELDKTIIEAIRDPLTHIIRNAVDHGIEAPDIRKSRGKPVEGKLVLHAFHEGGKVIIEITDDGAGIDSDRVRKKALDAKLITADQAAHFSERELLNLVFLPGFSTADRVTHFSGRGVGMDVVRTSIEKIGGAVDLESQLGVGTKIRMKIPLTLAIIPALTISSGGDRYAIPQVSLLELVRLEGEQAKKEIEEIHGASVYRLRGNLLPLVRLNDLLGVTSARLDDQIFIVVLQADDRQLGLIVDDIHDTEEIVVKPLQRQLKSIDAYAGATLMADGRVALILDVLGLARRSGLVSGTRQRPVEEAAEQLQTTVDRQTVLLCASRRDERIAVPLTSVARLEEFPVSALEKVGGRDVIQYRGEILPLIHVSKVLRGATKTKAGRRGSPKSNENQTVQVVVHSTAQGKVGLVVGKILDIIEEVIAVRAPTSRLGVQFTAVIQNRVTEFLDVEEIIRLDAAYSQTVTAIAEETRRG